MAIMGKVVSGMGKAIQDGLAKYKQQSGAPQGASIPAAANAVQSASQALKNNPVNPPRPAPAPAPARPQGASISGAVNALQNASKGVAMQQLANNLSNAKIRPPSLGMKKGGSVSASKRADGIAQRGKTKGKVI